MVDVGAVVTKLKDLVSSHKDIDSLTVREAIQYLESSLSATNEALFPLKPVIKTTLLALITEKKDAEKGAPEGDDGGAKSGAKTGAKVEPKAAPKAAPKAPAAKKKAAGGRGGGDSSSSSSLAVVSSDDDEDEPEAENPLRKLVMAAVAEAGSTASTTAATATAKAKKRPAASKPASPKKKAKTSSSSGAAASASASAPAPSFTYVEDGAAPQTYWEQAPGGQRKAAAAALKKLPKTIDFSKKSGKQPELDAEGKPVPKKPSKPSLLSEPLQAFLGSATNLMPRGEVTKQIIAYVKANKLQDPKDGRKILCDQKMKDLLKCSHCTFFSINKYLSSHIKDPKFVADQ